MRIADITAGAAGMFCGSCMHDNTLVAALRSQGHDALLIPTYTPIRTDEPDLSDQHIFFGGINVYLQQKFSLFRHTPAVLDHLLDYRPLLRWVSRFAVKTQAEDLGALALSMLKGEHGHQRKELDKLVHWLADDLQPELINLTNVILAAVVAPIKRRLKVPVLGTLQGDDIFLESLTPTYHDAALDLVREHCRALDGFIATSSYYADFMSEYLKIPRRLIDVVHPGLNLTGHGGPRPERSSPLTIGYFARICPEKGLHQLVEAFGLLRRHPTLPPCRLRISGWLGGNNQHYFNELQQRLHSWGLADQVEHIEAPDHASKVQFLQNIDILSVPTTYREPKGLYILESLANGTPVVQPRHGSFPELIEATGGGLLVKPDDAEDLARGLRELLENAELRAELGRKGQEMVQGRFTADAMARQTAEVYRKYQS